MATHKAFPNEILRCRSRMTRLEMLTTNYNLVQNAECKVQNFGSATLINNDINGNIVGMLLAGIRKITSKPTVDRKGRPYGCERKHTDKL